MQDEKVEVETEQAEEVAEPEEAVTEETVAEDAVVEPEGEEEAEEEVEAEPEPHIATYKRDGVDVDYEFKYGEDGKLTQESIDDLLSAKAKTGLEAKTQRAVEDRNTAQRSLEAANARLSKFEVESKQNEQLRPYIDAVKQDPQLRTGIAQKHRFQPTEYNPELARLEVENQALQEKDFDRGREQLFSEVRQQVSEKHDLTAEQVALVSQTMVDAGMQWFYDPANPEACRTVALNQAAVVCDALRSQGKLPDPKLIKLQAEKEAEAQKVKDARKRREAKSPSPGGGTTGTKASKKKPDLAGAGTADLVAEFRRRAGK